MGVSGNVQLKFWLFRFLVHRFQLANSFFRLTDGLFVKKSDTSVHTGVIKGIILSV